MQRRRRRDCRRQRRRGRWRFFWGRQQRERWQFVPEESRIDDNGFGRRRRFFNHHPLFVIIVVIHALLIRDVIHPPSVMTMAAMTIDTSFRDRRRGLRQRCPPRRCGSPRPVGEQFRERALQRVRHVRYDDDIIVVVVVVVANASVIVAVVATTVVVAIVMARHGEVKIVLSERSAQEPELPRLLRRQRPRRR